MAARNRTFGSARMRKPASCAWPTNASASIDGPSIVNRIRLVDGAGVANEKCGTAASCSTW
ncbi:hypothetical protein DIE18_08010 [Burkholderia sp. Bp9125]|nr:hypothetical protein DIE18_08010 [Burkholderia sp. Bp9125]